MIENPLQARGVEILSTKRTIYSTIQPSAWGSSSAAFSPAENALAEPSLSVPCGPQVLLATKFCMFGHVQWAVIFSQRNSLRTFDEHWKLLPWPKHNGQQHDFLKNAGLHLVMTYAPPHLQLPRQQQRLCAMISNLPVFKTTYYASYGQFNKQNTWSSFNRLKNPEKANMSLDRESLHMPRPHTLFTFMSLPISSFKAC